MMEFLRTMDCGFSDLAEALSFDYIWGVSLSGTALIDRNEWDIWPQTLVGFVDGGRIDIFFADGSRVRVPAGSGYCMLPGTKHRYRIEGGSRFRLWNAHIRYRILRGPDILSQLDLPTLIEPRTARVIGETCRLLFETHRSPCPTAQRLAKRLLGAGQLLAALAGVARNADGLTAWIAGTERLRPALEYIHAHFAKPLRRGELARLVHVSEPHLHDLFRSAMGVAPLGYVKRIRLEHAQHLLRATNTPVGETGRACGYPDPYHFTRTFTSAVGVPPSQYRVQSRRAWRETPIPKP